MKALVKIKAGPDGMCCMEVLGPVLWPVPGGDDLKVKVLMCRICGTDIHLLHDRYPCRLPVVTGYEFSGVVTEIGKNVRQGLYFQPGDGRKQNLRAESECRDPGADGGREHGDRRPGRRPVRAGSADGMDIDIDGNLWIAHWDG